MQFTLGTFEECSITGRFEFAAHGNDINPTVSWGWILSLFAAPNNSPPMTFRLLFLSSFVPVVGRTKTSFNMIEFCYDATLVKWRRCCVGQFFFFTMILLSIFLALCVSRRSELEWRHSLVSLASSPLLFSHRRTHLHTCLIGQSNALYI